jgi:hypothetical protein
MRVHLAGVTSANRESGGAGCGTAGVPRLGWAAMMRLLWPQRRSKAPCRGGRTLLGSSFQGSSSSRRRRLRRTLVGLGATQAEHLERRVLLAGDSFDSGMNAEAWAMATYEPSAEVCVPTGEWEFSSPSSNEASFSYEPASSEPVSFEPVSFSYSDTRCESAAPMETVPTVEPSNVSETSEPGSGYGWMGGNETAAAESPARIADGFGGAQSSDATDQMASGAAADTQDGDTSPVAFAQVGHPDDTGADPAEGCPGFGPVAEPSPSEMPRIPLSASAHQDDVYILHFTRMASADDAPYATITQEHKFVVVNRLTFLPRLSPAEIDLIEDEWNDGRPTPGPTSGRPGFEPRPELNGAVSCIGRLQPTTALNPQDAAALALGVETGLFLGGIFFEPLDWAITAREIYDEPGNPWSYAGLVPFVPAGVGKLGKYGDDIAPVAVKTRGAVAPREAVGDYWRVGGHHVHAKSGFKDSVLYSKSKGFSLSQDYMKSRGWDHEAMTRKHANYSMSWHQADATTPLRSIRGLQSKH